VPDGRLVYSTDPERRREPDPGPPAAADPGDGIVRVFREKSGRRGKTVTVVRGLPPADVRAVAGELKRLCGAGGAVKDGAVEVQGDHRDRVVTALQADGYRVKAAGG
jgi:translation initiation factor 1